ncbi:Uncharacterised protein [Bordetella pertussis]|nr:Uncharacterised protein [Bordetella pertussis]CPO09678.1 Uncharacterised protein [Bordetella pertussis]
MPIMASGTRPASSSLRKEKFMARAPQEEVDGAQRPAELSTLATRLFFHKE